MNKNELRSKGKAIRGTLTKDELMEKSENIFNFIFALDELKKSKNVFIFMNMLDEITTDVFIEKFIDLGKKVYIPKAKKTMTFHEYTGEFNISNYGIREPIEPEEKISDMDTLIIVPGLLYSEDFYRIGYGGGYYDKYLDSHTYYKTVGICFEEQMVKKLEVNSYDKAVDILVTDRKVRR
ncbi:MAG: 5-formyltetrahydrofolate cyclo-ligase [Lachnospirales bacterium]